MTFYKEWLLGLFLHYTFSHKGYCEVFSMLCLDDSIHPGHWPGEAQFGCGKLQKPNCAHWVMEEPWAIFAACQMEALPREFSTPIPLLAALYFQQLFLHNSYNLIYIIQERLRPRDCSSQYKPSCLRKWDTLNVDYLVYDRCHEVTSLQTAAVPWRKGKKILARYDPNCAFEYTQKHNLLEKRKW